MGRFGGSGIRPREDGWCSRLEGPWPRAATSWSIFDNPLPDGTELHINLGTGGTDDRFPGENDDVTGKPSLARAEAIAEATSVTQLDGAVHSGMVLDPEPLERFNEILSGLFLGQ
jgi:hypothetical protein